MPKRAWYRRIIIYKDNIQQWLPLPIKQSTDSNRRRTKMLMERITNPLITFNLLQANIPKEVQVIWAKKAFLFVIRTYNAFSQDKEGRLTKILEKCPELTDVLEDTTVAFAFRSFIKEAERKREKVSTKEIGLAKKYLRDNKNIKEITTSMYMYYLRSAYLDKQRQEFNWELTDTLKYELVKLVIRSEALNLGAKRKYELAKEFGFPYEQYLAAYYEKLLYDRHYDKAASLKINDPYKIITIIVRKIDQGDFRDALELSQRFLPERTDLIEEIQMIQSSF